MDTKQVLVGLLAATAISVATASVDQITEKQEQAKMMTSLLGGLTTVMYHPECTVHQPLKPSK